MAKNRQEKRKAWSKEQLAERKMAMERLHPGFVDMELRLRMWLGLILISRMFLHGVSIILEVESIGMLLLLPVNLLVCYGFYLVCIQQEWKIAWAFLLFRSMELGRMLVRSLPNLFYFNFWGDLWWVVTVTSLALDIAFLAAVACVPAIHRFVEREKIVYSGVEIGGEETRDELGKAGLHEMGMGKGTGPN